MAESGFHRRLCLARLDISCPCQGKRGKTCDWTRFVQSALADSRPIKPMKPFDEQEQDEALAALDIEELERLAIQLHFRYQELVPRLRRAHAISLHTVRDPKRTISPMLADLEGEPDLRELLFVRKILLNKVFQFTPESAARFARISDQLTDCVTKARAEAAPVVAELQRRIEARDPFLTDHEAALHIQPFLPGSGGEEPNIQDVLEELLHGSYAFLRPLASCDEGDLYTGRELNWNSDAPLSRHQELASHHIGYAMHELCAHALWSLPDILKIDRIRVDVAITRQHLRPAI